MLLEISFASFTQIDWCLGHFQTPVGNLRVQVAIREKNQCKPFAWFIENVAPDLVEHYPPIEPPDYANGTVSNVSKK